ncbi:hypothetical protein KP509_10G057900 [Ceratopteris richardii]|uniref:Uncharacterized protein n=1 Tax=Ceratopteris richardii TaxID=49495 RepID=A0A8T2U1S8_CERRI|nr:hypothetical protein KP509_10G057900 [Ceratopteris richardii]
MYHASAFWLIMFFLWRWRCRLSGLSDSSLSLFCPVWKSISVNINHRRTGILECTS